LLGSVYHLLHQVAEKLLLGQPIGNLGGPWWFINMWLSVHMHKRLGFNLFAQRFPRDIAEDHELDEEELATRSPLNYGEAAIVLPSTGGNEDQVSRFFQTLYEGLAKDQRAWMPYEDPETRFPLTFHLFDDALNKDHNLMMAIITPNYTSELLRQWENFQHHLQVLQSIGTSSSTGLWTAADCTLLCRCGEAKGDHNQRS